MISEKINEAADSQPTSLAVTIEPEAESASSGLFADLDALKLSLESAGLSGAAEVLGSVEVRNPKRDEFFRVRPEPENRFTTALLENREGFKREFYFVAPSMLPIVRPLEHHRRYLGTVLYAAKSVRHLPHENSDGHQSTQHMA